MADVFDNQVPTSWRVDLWSLIRSTPALDWFLLTKRPQNIGDMLPTDWGDGWPQVWLGSTAENQEEANRRIPHLVAIPAAVRFLSVEPMVEPVDVAPWLAQPSHGAKALISWIIVKSPLIGRCSVDHLAHLIDTTARPRAPQPRHRTRSRRSSTLRCCSRPSRDRNAGVTSAVCEHAPQSIFTKSPGPRSAIRAA